MLHEIILDRNVGSMDVMLITKFNLNLMLITEIRFFERQVSAITFFAEGWAYLLHQFNWGEVLCVPSR
jgi:hypothetical protein